MSMTVTFKRQIVVQEMKAARTYAGQWSILVRVESDYRQEAYKRLIDDMPDLKDYIETVAAENRMDAASARWAFPDGIFK